MGKTFERDRAPIDQEWIKHYCDEFIKVGQQLSPGAFRDAVLRRVECAQDLMEAWQLRNVPFEQRESMRRLAGKVE